jgi:TetR/AcrR family transcriptional repressor of nem operon
MHMTKAERTRQFIIEKSAPIINKKGMAATSLSDIMTATKLAKGGIYGNFENKDEICQEAFTYLAKHLSDRLDAKVAGGQTARIKFYNLLSFYTVNDPMEGGCPILNFGVESDDTHPLIREKVKKEIESMQRRIFELIRDGIQNKELSPELNPDTFSIKTFAILESGILLKKIYGNNHQMNILIQSVKDEFERYLL